MRRQACLGESARPVAFRSRHLDFAIASWHDAPSSHAITALHTNTYSSNKERPCSWAAG